MASFGLHWDSFGIHSFPFVHSALCPRGKLSGFLIYNRHYAAKTITSLITFTNLETNLYHVHINILNPTVSLLFVDFLATNWHDSVMIIICGTVSDSDLF